MKAVVEFKVLELLVQYSATRLRWDRKLSFKQNLGRLSLSHNVYRKLHIFLNQKLFSYLLKFVNRQCLAKKYCNLYIPFSGQCYSTV
jgi:hypothetical protein